MNFQGCIWKLDRKRAAAWFEQHDMADVEIDWQRQKEYKGKYLGIEETSASHRILAQLDSL